MWARPWLLLTESVKQSLDADVLDRFAPGGESAFPREGDSLEWRRRDVKAPGSSGSPCRSDGSYRSPRAGRVEQHLGRGAGRARERGIAAHKGGREGAFDEDLELGGEGVGVPGLQALEEGAEPEPALLLELQCDARRGVLGITELGDRIDIGAAAEAAVGEHALKPIEVAEDLLARRRVGGFEVPEARRQVGGDQVVLGGIVVVQRALADARLGGHRVDAHGANPLPVEELVGGGEDALGRRGNRSVYFHVDTTIPDAGS